MGTIPDFIESLCDIDSFLGLKYQTLVNIHGRVLVNAILSNHVKNARYIIESFENFYIGCCKSPENYTRAQLYMNGEKNDDLIPYPNYKSDEVIDSTFWGEWEIYEIDGFSYYFKY